MAGFNTLGVNQGSMSMDQYTGSVDHAIANLRIGRNQGYNEGIEDGIEEGLQAGYQQGFDQGRNVGWDAAIKEANVELRKTASYIRQHVSDKAVLQEEVLRLNQKLLELEQKLHEMESQNTQLRGANTRNSTLLGLVDSLKRANLNRQQDLETVNNELRERTEQRNRQAWQYNRSVVFMHAVRGVLEDIIGEKHDDALRVKTLFVEKYNQEVERAVGARKIKKAPHLDAGFESALPKTNQFILKMLEADNKDMVFENEKPIVITSSSWLLKGSPSP